ncbi:MAG: FAD binding domain-containing protein, partial [Firmicutes bacterium]|nr:FAD binding domain-containing protein [Bacillota bacterium]
AEIRQEGNKLVLGATVRHYQLEEDPLIRQTVPLLAEVAPYIGHAQIRHRGTVCGSLVHADPAAELPAAMLALDAELVAEGPGGRRTIPFREFYLGYLMTTLAPDELVVAVRVPIPAPGTGWGFQEISRRHGDFAIAGAAVLVALHLDGSVSQACIALTGVSGAALRAAEVEAALAGKLPTPEVLAEVSSQVADLVDAETDLHATLEYRRQVAAVVTERALAMAVKRAQGGQPK